MEDQLPSNRRIGQRLPIPDLVVTWEVARRGRFRTKTVVEEVRVVNASASGAGVIARTVPDLVRRALVPISADGHVLVAQVCRVEPTADPEATYYGVQFLDPSAEAIDHLLSHAGEGDREAIESYWRRAH